MTSDGPAAVQEPATILAPWPAPGSPGCRGERQVRGGSGHERGVGTALGIFVAVVALALLMRLTAGSLDAERIDEYVSARGGKLLERRWHPFGKGWFGAEGQRIYEIRYRDGDGDVRQATVKTSMLGGVYLTEDRIVDGTDGAGRASASQLLRDNRRLAVENERLTAEVERLRRGPA